MVLHVDIAGFWTVSSSNLSRSSYLLMNWFEVIYCIPINGDTDVEFYLLQTSAAGTVYEM